jgi:phosphatidate cytidylyltransferase
VAGGSNLAARIGSACVFVPAVLALVWLGDAALLVLAAGVAGRGSWELFVVAEGAGYRPVRWVGLPLSVALCGYLYLFGPARLDLILGAAVLVCLAAALGHGVERYAGNALLTLAAVLYLGLLGSAPLLIAEAVGPARPEEARWLLVAVLLGVWLTDAAAYFGGRWWGKRRMAPSISPAKTWAGFAAGLVGGLAPVSLASLLPSLTVGQVAGLLALVSLGGQAGDLVESALKRDLGVKDMPALIPGHGGVLDRFDSYLFSCPVAYLYLELLRVY